MTEREKLEAKVALVRYAEGKGFMLLRDYGSWIAIGQLPTEEEQHITKALAPYKKRKVINDEPA